MRHVLIIDADKRLRTVYAKSLQNAGFSVSEAASAQSAISQLENRLADIIVLELQLQGHSGVEFLQELRSYPEWDEIPVLLHTMIPNENLKVYQQAFKTYGIKGYAYKADTSLAKLTDAVERVLAVKR